MSYRVDLPVFSGPMDLLLHLVRQQEVDIHEVRIARILDQYLQHLNVLESLDLADIGDFVVMAGTLMEIKSRELLPREEVRVEEMLDPRDDLIQRLLEYKRFRDLSRRLDRMAARRAQMVAPLMAMPESLDEQEPEDFLDLGDVRIWTLTEAFARLLQATGQASTMHVGVETRTVQYYIEHILTKVKLQREIPFEQLFEVKDGRLGLIGVFIAMLEMMKQGFLRAHQEDCFGPITVVFKGDQSVTADQIMAETDEQQGQESEAGSDAEGGRNGAATEPTSVQPQGLQGESEGTTSE